MTDTQHNLDKAIVIGDTHIPFEDPKAIKLVLDFIKDLKPNEVILDGDILDCWEISKFDKDPRTGKQFREELELGKEFFNNLRKIFKGHIVYILGNHEYRLQSYIIRNAAPLIGLDGLSIQDQLKLDKFKIEVVSSGLKENYYKYAELYIGHFNKVSKHSGYTAKLLVDDKGVNLIQAHTHRMGMNLRKYLDGRILGGWENGCLCDLHPSYVQEPNWQHGFHVVFKAPNNKRFQVVPVPMIDHEFMWGNNRYYI